MEEKAAGHVPMGFRIVPNTRGQYAVSEEGEVWSVVKGEIIPQKIKRIGYKYVSIPKWMRNQTSYLVQYLVMETFIGPRPEGMEVDHINRQRDDNRLQNLRYVSLSLNGHNRLGVKHKSKIKYRGIIFRKHRQHCKAWVAKIRNCGKPVWSKYFNTPKEAALAYDEMAIGIYGSSSITNKSLGFL